MMMHLFCVVQIGRCCFSDVITSDIQIRRNHVHQRIEKNYIWEYRRKQQRFPTLLMNLHETSDELIEEATKIRFVNF